MVMRVARQTWLRSVALLGAGTLAGLLGCSDSGGEAGDCVDGALGCACVEGNTCNPGLSCSTGVCVAASGETGTSGDGDGDISGDGDPTTSSGDGDGEPGPTTCHPLMPADCPVVGTTCTWDGEQFQCQPAMIKIGDSCVPDSPRCISGFCAPMETLADCPSTHCCAAFCNLDAPNCPAGSSCVDYFPDGATTAEVGACLSP